jgi:hypothetical protein
LDPVRSAVERRGGLEDWSGDEARRVAVQVVEVAGGKPGAVQMLDAHRYIPAPRALRTALEAAGHSTARLAIEQLLLIRFKWYPSEVSLVSVIAVALFASNGGIA